MTAEMRARALADARLLFGPELDRLQRLIRDAEKARDDAQRRRDEPSAP